MSHYVVTTADHRNPLGGDSLEDCFCTRGVAEMRFESYVDAGYPLVRLVRWAEGEPVEISRHEVLYAQPQRKAGARYQTATLPAMGTAALRWFKHQVAAARPLRPYSHWR